MTETDHPQTAYTRRNTAGCGPTNHCSRLLDKGPYGQLTREYRPDSAKYGPDNRCMAGGSFGNSGRSSGSRHMTEDKDQCTHCGYEWTYTGDMPDGAFVTCPACRNATKLVESVDTEP